MFFFPRPSPATPVVITDVATSRPSLYAAVATQIKKRGPWLNMYFFRPSPATAVVITAVARRTAAGARAPIQPLRGSWNVQGGRGPEKYARPDSAKNAR